ncbi:MAG: hypothetical protein JNL11_03345 [Bdellovibrionaceae bacterium]|nr:hypothetical protein [Pseudobdellovibrionaceae bacterium]
MKRQLLLVLFTASFIGIGCSSKKSETATPPADTTIVTNPTDDGGPGGGGTGGGLTTSTGATVAFVPVDWTIFNSYVGTHPINSPKNVQINVDLKDNGSLRYYGSIKISYEDNGQTFTGTFESGDGKNQDISGLKDNNVMESVYNYWYTKDSKTVFSGLFQDQYGAVVLVIDKSINQGDGQGSAFVSGSIYFRNFAQSMATQSPYRKCWFIYTGPYDCRTDTIMKKTDLYPTTGEGYRKLGTFSGLNRAKAFNL